MKGQRCGQGIRMLTEAFRRRRNIVGASRSTLGRQALNVDLFSLRDSPWRLDEKQGF